MADPSHFDIDKTTGALALLTGIVTVVVTPIKFFMPRKTAEGMFVKKVEADGTRAYVHPQEWEEMKQRMDHSIEQGEKWQSIAKDWIERS